MHSTYLPLGKLPPAMLEEMIGQMPARHPRLLFGPRLGMDCAVLESAAGLLVLKSDPVTFATDAIGWYVVQVNANDIATSGAEPRWFMLTALLPEETTTPELVQDIAHQVGEACRALGVTVIGGHTEITQGLTRPILIGTMLGETKRRHLVTAQGAQPGDRLLLTKGVPIEATAILARELPERLSDLLTPDELRQAQDFLYKPGISVLDDAHIAARIGRVTAMHDPTEGGLAGALWELADASQRTLVFDPSAVPIPDLARKVCDAFGLDPLAAIASGALLLTVQREDVSAVCKGLEKEGIPCAEIGDVKEGPPQVWINDDGQRRLLERPLRDEIARLFEEA